MTTQQKAGVDVPKAVRVAEAYCYDAGAPNAAKNLRATVAELISRNDELEAVLRQSGEAVAWQVRFKREDGSYYGDWVMVPDGRLCAYEDMDDSECDLRPLYATPPATSGLVEMQQELVIACKQRDALDVECARLEQAADGLVEALRAAHEELAAIKRDWHGPGPKMTSDGGCAGCGRWTPWRHPEAHDHEEGCQENSEWVRRRDWQQRIAVLGNQIASALAAHDARGGE